MIRWVRKGLYALEINVNRLLGREMIPVKPDELNVETCSACNLACRFCAYPKKTSPKVSMKDESFYDCIEQAVALGYRKFMLTPSTGDIFMDHHVFRKLQYLDEHPLVGEYHFYTNLTIPKPDDVTRLMACTKLKGLTISVYGHDLESFKSITGGTDKLYARLMANLERLLELAPRRTFALTVRLQSTKDGMRKASRNVSDVFARFKQAGVALDRSTIYHSWAGLVTDQDVQGLDIDLKEADVVYKKGACMLMFTGVQVMATGVVHACSCVDVDGALEIGNLHEKPLHEIVSTRNPTYMKLIADQQRGEFLPVCQSCAFYKSIYHGRRGPTQTLQAFKDMLDAKAQALSSAGVPKSTAEPATATDDSPSRATPERTGTY